VSKFYKYLVCYWKRGLGKDRGGIKVKWYYQKESLGRKKEVRTSRGLAEVGIMCSYIRITIQNRREFSLYNEKLSRDYNREIELSELSSSVIPNPVLYGR
jgi:hypothetical protein